MKTSLSVLLLLIIFGISANGQTREWLWAKGYGGIRGAYSEQIYADANDNVYVVGSFYDSIEVFGNDTLTNYNDSARNMFVVKYDPTGNVLWAKTASGSSDNIAHSICTDANSNVYITGYFYSPIIVFGKDTLTNNGESNFFVLKYGTSGDLVWVKSFKGTDGYINYGYGIAADANSNIYVTGSFNDSTIIFGADTLSGITYNGFVAKYDSAGNAIWGKSSNVPYGSCFSRVAITDSKGNIYITGYYDSPTLTFGSITLTNVGTQNIFIAKYDTTGNVIWANNVGGNNIDYGTGIAADVSGNVYVTGDFNSDTVIIGNDTLINADSTGYNANAFLAKYDALGNAIWAKSLHDDLNSTVTFANMSLDNTGNIYLASGYENDTVIFGNDTLINTIGSNSLLVEYDSSGDVVNVKSIGAQSVNSICVDNKNNIYLTGEFSGSLVFGNDSLTGSRGFPISDIFIAKYGLADTTGIANTPIGANSIIVYPNPSTGQFYFKGINSGSIMEIYDALGQTIYSSTVTGDNYLLNLTGQAKGMYFYRVIDKSANVQDGKIVVE